MKKKRGPSRAVIGVKVIVFGSVLAAMCILGLLVFLRPTVSVVEKRQLTAFPEFTWEGLWDGSFFSGIDAWYADTYPMREELIDAQQSMESRYGLRGTQLVGGSMTADAVPVPGQETADPNATPGPTPEPTPEPLPDGTVHTPGEFYGSIYITEGAAYGLYGFSQSNADAYVAAMNQVYQNIGDKVDMYVMNVPLSSAIMLDADVWQDMGCSDEGAAIEYINSQLDPGIHAVPICDTLREHNAEYVYFRTDHHWTQLGAYYAYRKFCEVKGITPHELDQFTMREFGAGRYLGTYYTSADRAPVLAMNPDTVQAWYPMCVNANDSNDRDMHLVESDGTEYDWRIINDMYEMTDGAWYFVFSGTDQPFCSLHNPDLHDGSAVMLVKDSFGNPFVPWLVDHYEYTYWVDYRYTENTVSQMVQDYGVQDVIFETATFNATDNMYNDTFRRIGS